MTDRPPEPAKPASSSRRSRLLGLRSRARLRSVTVWLIALNCLIHLVRIVFGVTLWRTTEAWGGFNVAEGIYHGQAWRAVSFQFLHANYIHLGLNCMGLWIFGPPVERRVGRGRFTVFYLLCGIGGAAAFVLLYWTNLIDGSDAGMLIGASAGVFGLIAASMTLIPHRVLMLAIPPIDITVFRFGLVWLFVGAFMVIAYGYHPQGNAGGHAAHLGGAAIGFLLARQFGWLDWADRFSGGRRPPLATPPADRQP